MTIEDGTNNARMLLVEIATSACQPTTRLSWTVQGVLAPRVRVLEAHVNEEIERGRTSHNVADCELLPKAAVMVALREAPTTAPAAVKFALVAPAGTVTLAGTVRAVSDELSKTVWLDLTVWLNVTAQAEVKGVYNNGGVQLKVLTVIGVPIVMVPPEPAAVMPAPSGEAASVPVTPIATLVVTAGDRVTVTTATVPLAIVFSLIPKSIQR